MDNLPGTNIDSRFQQDLIQSRCFHPTGNFVRFEKEEIEQSIPDRFEQQVSKYPQRLAVKAGSDELTYEELNRAANRIAREILNQIGESNEPVVLLLKYGVSVPVGIMAALKAGKSYVPLDPTYPRTRSEYMLRDSQANLVITDSQNLSLARELGGNALKMINIDEIDSNASADNPGLSISPDAVAYIIYTSGSTGEPKGVFNSHRNLLHHIRRFTNCFHICADDRLSILRSFSFNGALKELYGSLLNGAALFPFNVKTEGVTNLANWMMQQEITLYVSVVTAFRQFADTLTERESFPKLRAIYIGAEASNSGDVELYKKFFSLDCIFGHGLGTSETGTIRRYFIDKNMQISDGNIPAGYPVEDMEILLLDEDRRELRCDQVGEIAVRSQYMALGYWRKPEHTQKAFLPDLSGGKERIYLTGDLGTMLPDGCLLHLGREDFQIKVRGHRIEAAEVETALLTLDAIKEATVVAREDHYGDQTLAAYLVPAGQKIPTVTEMRRTLAKDLPEYMIPSIFVTLDALPLTPDSKIDRRALPEPDKTRPDLESDFVGARDSVELRLKGIWEEILDIHPIGVQDNFFELGGHSLVAARLLTRTQKEFSRTLPLSVLLQAPTVEQMADLVRQEERSPSRSSLAEIQPEGSRPPFFAVHANDGEVMFYADLARNLGSEQPFYGLRAQGLDKNENPHTRIEDMAAYYVGEIKTVQPEGPYYLGGAGVGGMIAFEMAQQLLAQGQKVNLLVLIDTEPPRSPDHRQSLDHLRRIPRMFMSPRIRRVRNVMDTAPLSYIPQTYPGRIIYFVSEKHSESGDSPHNPVEKWRDLTAGEFNVYVVPGEHLSMLEEPNVRVMADKLKACLDEIQT